VSHELQVDPDGLNDVGSCPDCGNPTRVVWGYVSAGGEPRAVYFARWTPGHRERGAQLLISLGEWGEGARRETRRAVGLECRMGSEVPSFMVVDASALPWSDEILGRKLSRDDAIASEASAEAFRVVDALWKMEPRFRGFLLDG
jgi:hypothetical protein